MKKFSWKNLDRETSTKDVQALWEAASLHNKKFLNFPRFWLTFQSAWNVWTTDPTESGSETLLNTQSEWLEYGQKFHIIANRNSPNKEGQICAYGTLDVLAYVRHCAFSRHKGNVSLLWPQRGVRDLGSRIQQLGSLEPERKKQHR